MSLSDTPGSERIRIGFFGSRNAGKSSLLNAVTNQDLAVVSDIKGTTTDPVSKTMELLPLGPVVMTDTPGFDDEGELGALRMEKTRQIIRKTDIAVLVIDASAGMTAADRELEDLFKANRIRYIIAQNKCDLLQTIPAAGENEIYVSARDKTGIHSLKERIAALTPRNEAADPIVRDLLRPGDIAVLVCPIDESAPKGRLILPQQMTIRDVLDADASAVVTKETGLRDTLSKLGGKPAMVITDSQVFPLAAKETPQEVPLTSFSILMARHRGFLVNAVRGAASIDDLEDGDRVLIAEGCTHHRQCGDIGSVKLPNLLKKYTGKSFQIELASGTGFPKDLTPFRLVLHCGGCMQNSSELIYRNNLAAAQQVPMTNYGIAIAYMNGILERTIRMIPEAISAYRKRNPALNA